MICLSRMELLDVSGFRRPSSVSKWLRQNGFVFVVAADGWPRVDTEHFHARMGSASPRTLKKSEPNMKALMETQRNGTQKAVATRST